MILNNVVLLNQPKKNNLAIQIKGDTIDKIYSTSLSNEPKAIHFEQALVIPGLINSHDHLCLNLFPRLGTQYYSDYKEWAEDVQTNFKAEIGQLAGVDKTLLYQWGILKNLINGVTTVVQHGPFYPSTFDHLLHVYTRTYPLHSISFEPGWKIKVLRPTRKPIVMHLGEGISKAMERELKLVNNWNIFRNTIIPVHGISLTPELTHHFKALIWCPESNYELYRSSLNVPSIYHKIPILFGSDSTISASWNIWRHFQRVSESQLLNNEQLLSTLTTNPVKVWKLGKKGQVKEGFTADLTIIDQPANNPRETFHQASPADIIMVIKAGKIVLCDDRIWPQLPGAIENDQQFHKIKIENTYKWINADIGELMRKIKASAPSIVFPFGI